MSYLYITEDGATLSVSGEVTAWGGKFTDEEEVIII